jgi:predicted phage terminase large subunit-like protein
MMDDFGFSAEELQLLLGNIDRLSPGELAEVNRLMEELESRKTRLLRQTSLIEFCKHMQEDYKVGSHHKRLAGLLEDIECRKRDRICVSVAPRHGKSQLVSIYYTAWYLGRNPTHKVMLVSHTTDLAVDFGRKIRNLIATPKYREVFPDIELSVDSKSAGRWSTNSGGEFYASGVGAALAGRGAHMLVVDDPHSEQDILGGNLNVFDKAYEWFTFGARTRLMPGGAVAIVATRWSVVDLIGRVTKDMIDKPDADQYEIFEFPAILNDGEKNEAALWPEFFDLEALHRTKASMPTFQWNAQYQQDPTSEEAAIVKREWWGRWTKDKPPPCEYVIASLDAAAETNNRADFTSLTTWGVFNNEETDRYELILLDSITDRFEFPELKALCLKHWNEWEPDSFIVEKKSAGVAIYQELRRMGIPLKEFTPHRGTGDKYARLNSVSDIIASGIVWVPNTKWADELVEEIAAFPNGAHDDRLDSTVQALMRFRQGGFIRLPTDYEDEPLPYRHKVEYY